MKIDKNIYYLSRQTASFLAGNKTRLRRVGIVGQSLDGCTAMASAGVKIDWQHLQHERCKLENLDRLDFNPAL